MLRSLVGSEMCIRDRLYVLRISLLLDSRSFLLCPSTPNSGQGCPRRGQRNILHTSQISLHKTLVLEPSEVMLGFEREFLPCDSIDQGGHATRVLWKGNDSVSRLSRGSRANIPALSNALKVSVWRLNETKIRVGHVNLVGRMEISAEESPKITQPRSSSSHKP